jgi:hypothetical protein
MPRLLSATTDDGAVLPIVDITNPAFAVTVADAELTALSDQFVLESSERPAMAPAMRDALQRSRLGRGLMAAAGTFLAGMSTYLLKLGPENLGDDASPIDRRIAASFPALVARLRLQDMARLLADGVAVAAADPPRRPLCFVNIGGGPAADSWNALIHLQTERPGVLEARPIAITVLDLDDHGPAFGIRALEALGAPGAPLEGLDIGVRHLRSSWADLGVLGSALAEFRAGGDAMCAVSSEGALFEYGSDAEIGANLEMLHAGTAADAIVVGSVAREGDPMRALQTSDRAATRPRTLQTFESLVEPAGWIVEHVIERPFSYNVRLVKR